MAVLLEVRNSDGIVGRCDAKCYDATEPRCRCVCQGTNHGKGELVACAQTRDLLGAYEGASVEIRHDPRADQSVFDWVLPKP